ncbi:MAG: DUF2945 domain-containing protein [Pseudomonadota bacterium]
MSDIAVGDRVRWNWASGVAEGVVVERHDADVTRTFKGSEVTRRASPDSPAFVIEQDDGDQVLKSITEIEKD